MMQRTMWFFAAVAGRTTTAGQHAEDAAWVARASQGDETALATLYDLHSRAVYSLALRIVGDELDRLRSRSRSNPPAACRRRQGRCI